MCGISALWSPDPADHDVLPRATDMMAHRGPDNGRVERHGPVSLGHRRLSILDLSEAGNQPMSNEDGSVHVVCNGEIYNYLELRAELKARGHAFRSGSDSEVLLHLYEEHGSDLLRQVNGMFAFVLWDERRRLLVAAVDRFGKKPLYFARGKDRLALTSELKGLLPFSWVDRAVDPVAIDRYMSLRHVPAPLTIFASIRKLCPAQMLLWDEEGMRVASYWRPTYEERREPEATLAEEFAATLEDAVRIRLHSDVPLGIYLSAGVDSTSIAGLMRRHSTGRRISYTVGFDNEHNEEKRARAFAEHLGFDFNPVRVDPHDFDHLERIAWHLDEPFGDMIVVPAYKLAAKAKESLTVVLTGDGADEILNGYLHHKVLSQRSRWDGIFALPGVARLAALAVQTIPAAVLDAFFDYPDRFGPRERLKLAQTLELGRTEEGFYEGLMSWFTPQDKAALYTPALAAGIGENTMGADFWAAMHSVGDFPFLARLTLLDLRFWLPFIVLYRLDKLNMAHAVETRSPFLDYRLVQLALNLPAQLKLGGARSKEAIRRVHDGLYPPSLHERGKQAFYIPFLSAYKKRLLPWFQDMCSRSAVERRGYFRWEYVRDTFAQMESGSMLANRQMVSLAMLEQWHRVFLDGDGGWGA